MLEITTGNTRFLDALGRECILHGLNLKCAGHRKDDPEYGILAEMNEEFFRRSAAHGFNLLRLGIGWETFEPEHGEYDEALLRRVDEIFALAEKYGVYVFLDMHQDLYASFGVGNGNGMPAWATVADGIKRAETPRFVWAEGYFWSRAVHRAFDHFWANTPVYGTGLQDHFAELWQMLARRYADCPAFLGFDLLNEPFPGAAGGKVFRKLVAKLVRVCLVSPKVQRIRFFKTALNKKTRGYALDVLTPEVLYKVVKGGAAEKILRKFYIEQYSPFIAKMTDAIREVTSKGVIFVEQCYFSNIAVPFSVAMPEGERICYSPHGYDFMVDTPGYAFANNERVGAIFAENHRAQQQLNVPVVVGEWGGGGEGESFFPHIEYLMNLFDSFSWSNAYFTYGKGFFERPIVRVLSRPYPMAVNGEISRFDYHTPARRFTLEFTQRAETDPALPTVIYLPCSAQKVQADGFEWREEAIPESAGHYLLLTGGTAGTHTVTVTLPEPVMDA